MKFKQVTIPAHTRYMLTRIRGKERDQFYTPNAYNSYQEARIEADKKNARYRGRPKLGTIAVQAYHYEESEGLEGFLPL